MRHTPPAGRRPAPAPRETAETAANKHQQRTAATRRSLLQSARRIFARVGFEASRIEDIAAATGHTRGAFYAHFPTKEDVFFAIFEQEIEQRVKEIRSVLDDCKNAAERTAALRRFYLSRINDRQWALLVLEFKLFALRHPRLRPKLAATHRELRAAFRLDCVDHAWDEPKKAALEAILSGLLLEHAYDPLRISKPQAITILGFLFDALMPSHE